MTTKLDKLKAAWAAGDKMSALSIANKFPRLGDHKAAIQAGWAAANHRDFYKSIGKDPDTLLAIAYTALQQRYDLP